MRLLALLLATAALLGAGLVLELESTCAILGDESAEPAPETNAPEPPRPGPPPVLQARQSRRLTTARPETARSQTDRRSPRALRVAPDEQRAPVHEQRAPLFLTRRALADLRRVSHRVEDTRLERSLTNLTTLPRALFGP
jgi:hypothetical protein